MSTELIERRCACLCRNAYDCWSARYDVSRHGHGTMVLNVEDDGGPCACSCHDDDSEFDDEAEAALRARARTDAGG